MKTFKSYLVLFAVVSIISISCKQNTDLLEEDAVLQNETNSSLAGGVIGDLSSQLLDLTFCNAKTVPICAGQTINVGDVSVQTAIDGRTFVTYSLKGNWYFKELHLYLGPKEGIPVSGGGSASPGQFPYHMTFNLSERIQKYTFIIDGLPELYTVAAHSSVYKLAGNGNILQQETGWGDGCTGKKIADKGAWGTFVNYTGQNCTLSAAMNEAIEICSRPVMTYFGLHPSYDMIVPWDEPTVTVAGYTYTEEEARAIGNCTDENGTVRDSKYGFTRVATLKLSRAPYEMSASIAPAVEVIEAWLKEQGKLSAEHLPTGNAQVRNAAALISQWIDGHNCPERR